MATQTQTAQAPPQITVLNRVASIPLVCDSLATLHSTLTSNPYTRSPYSAAQAIGNRAYRVSEPIQIRLAPVIVRADGFANKAVDVVESRYPYPFKTPTEEIYSHLRQNGDYAVDVANKTLDERVRSPAYGIAQGIDQRFTPVVDQMEVVVNKLQGQKFPESTDSNGNPLKDQYQYQRAYRLSLGLKDHLYVYTSEQVRQIQEHNVLVQRATATAHNVTEVLASSLGAASTKVQSLSDKMLQELQKLQQSTLALPSHLQSSFHGLSDGVSHTISDLSGIITSDLPLNEKIQRIRATVEGKVQPLLETATATMQDAVRVVSRKSEVTVNGVKEKKAQGQETVKQKKARGQERAKQNGFTG